MQPHEIGGNQEEVQFNSLLMGIKIKSNEITKKHVDSNAVPAVC